LSFDFQIFWGKGKKNFRAALEEDFRAALKISEYRLGA
jgi:hypothetical protein